MIFLGWIILAFLVGMLASSRGRNFFGYFALALLLSPIVGLLIVLIVGSPAEPVVPIEPTRKCPYCAETIKAEAKLCRYCDRDVPVIATIRDVDQAGVPGTVAVERAPQWPPSWAWLVVLAILCVASVVVIGIVQR